MKELHDTFKRLFESAQSLEKGIQANTDESDDRIEQYRAVCFRIEDSVVKLFLAVHKDENIKQLVKDIVKDVDQAYKSIAGASQRKEAYTHYILAFSAIADYIRKLSREADSNPDAKPDSQFLAKAREQLEHIKVISNRQVR